MIVLDERAGSNGTIRLDRLPVQLAGCRIKGIEIAVHIAKVKCITIQGWCAPDPVFCVENSLVITGGRIEPLELGGQGTNIQHSIGSEDGRTGHGSAKILVP